MAKLYAPVEYWKLSKTALAELVNGCGPAGWKGKYIPDHLLGVSISEPCNIHDYMYGVGETEEHREEADRVFNNNMLRTVEAESTFRFTRAIRRRLALHYYSIVRDHGAQYFWVDKNPPETFKDPAEFGAEISS